MERSVLVAGLAEVDPAQPFGAALFDQISRLSVTVTVEAVCLRKLAGRIQVYLIQKPADDPRYASQWCMPGTILRPREDEEGAFKRLEQGKFGGKFAPEKYFVGKFQRHHGAEGSLLPHHLLV